MIPILYEKGEISFTSNGICRLRDCLSCVVTEERNGAYEVEFEYPVDGANFNQIILGRSVGVTHDDAGDIQPFDLVSYTKPIDGVVKFKGVHVSYRLNKAVVTASEIDGWDSAVDVFMNSSEPSTPFTYSSDTEHTERIPAFNGTPRAIRQILGGVEGSILDTYGGEYVFNLFNVKLMAARGIQRDMTIRYGLNMSGYEEEADYSEAFTEAIPYWEGDGKVVVGNLADSGRDSYNGVKACVPLDLTEQFDTAPTKARLRTKALSMINSNKPFDGSRSISVDFVNIKETGEFAEYADLLKCNLCDSVKVVFPKYGVEGYFKIVRTEYDVLKDRYASLQLGSLSTSLSEALGLGTETSSSGVGVSGVKGDAETDYRTGDVNLTPADIGALATSGGTLTGQISGLFKISTVAVTLSSGIGANSNVSAANRTMTAQSGYNAVGIVGWQSSQWRIRPTTNYILNNTTLYAGFANDSATAVSQSTTVTFRVLWMRASE